MSYVYWLHRPFFHVPAREVRRTVPAQRCVRRVMRMLFPIWIGRLYVSSAMSQENTAPWTSAPPQMAMRQCDMCAVLYRHVMRWQRSLVVFIMWHVARKVQSNGRNKARVWIVVCPFEFSRACIQTLSIFKSETSPTLIATIAPSHMPNSNYKYALYLVYPCHLFTMFIHAISANDKHFPEHVFFNGHLHDLAGIRHVARVMQPPGHMAKLENRLPNLTPKNDITHKIMLHYLHLIQKVHNKDEPCAW